MKVRVNGEDRDLPEGATVSAVLTELGFTGLVAVELNGEVVRRKDHPETAIREGDALEVVHFVGGG